MSTKPRDHQERDDGVRERPVLLRVHDAPDLPLHLRRLGQLPHLGRSAQGRSAAHPRGSPGAGLIQGYCYQRISGCL